MRTFGKNDFTDFSFIRDDYLFKFYEAKNVLTQKPHSILIMEVDCLQKALDIMNESFILNSKPHKGMLKFCGVYL